MNLLSGQIELLKLLAQGLTLKAVAEKLGVSYNTVKTRTKLLYKKFVVNNRKDLIAKAIKLNFIKTKDVKRKFRKRFIRPDNLSLEFYPEPLVPLTERDLKYLKLAAQGASCEELIKKVPLASKYHERYVNRYICTILGAKNITQAITIAFMMEIL